MDPESGLDAGRYLGISAGKIQALSTAPLSGRTVIDARGLVVAPGFIDLHQHSHNHDADRAIRDAARRSGSRSQHRGYTGRNAVGDPRDVSPRCQIPRSPVPCARARNKEAGILARNRVLAAALVSGAPLQIVHANSSYTSDVGQLFEMIDAARKRGLDVTTECYPYTAGMHPIELALYDDSRSWPDERVQNFEWPASP
jgi:dihydroorotase-like cyclic amidohydrolase